MVSDGYKIPFSNGRNPPPSHLPNNRSALNDKPFIEQQLHHYESLGCIKHVDIKPEIILPLSSVLSNRKRLVVDGSRNLNPFIADKPVQLSHLERAN